MATYDARKKYTETICGDNSEEETPVPIPNTEVKLLSADDTWWETAWESKTLPLIFLKAACFSSCFLICLKYRFDISGISTKSTSPIESAEPTLFFVYFRGSGI